MSVSLLYKANFEDNNISSMKAIAAYAYISALINNTEINLKKAIFLCQKHFGEDEDTWPFDTIKSQYYRLGKRVVESKKTKA